jgi:muramoyltetrapeptide carboxypeptidase
MGTGSVVIGVVAPGGRIEPAIAEKISALAASLYPDRRAELRFHPHCFLSAGHFAGDDRTRTQAFLDVANDPDIAAVWIARGGYGSGRIAESVLAGITDIARAKTYLGYSDAGALFAALYGAGCGGVAHGPMPIDLTRPGGEAAIARALAFLVERNAATLEPSVSPSLPSAAFNLTILGHLLGTPQLPDLSGHVLMLEEVSEPLYRIDRSFCQLSRSAEIRRVAGIRLGRCSLIAPNQPEFGETPEAIAAHWCGIAGICYLGRADIGHDIDNKIVPFGRWVAADTMVRPSTSSG